MGKKQATPLQQAVTELNKASRKKADLKHLETQLLMTVPPNATIAALQKAAMEKLMTEIAGDANDLMGFGKYSDKTYAAVKEQDTKYCEWAKAISKEEATSTHLRRFVEWLNMTEAAAGKATKTVVTPLPKKKPPAKEGYGATPINKEVMSTPGPSETPASSSTDATVQQLTQVVAQLVAEVKDLKEDRSAAMPRKMPAKSDVEMKKDQDSR